MNKINPNDILNQIRTLGAELRIGTATPAADAPTAPFGTLLKNSIQAVNAAQHEAKAHKVGFELGTSDASLAEVMIAGQKADLSFKAVAEVRNKLVTAYQEIMNMPV